MVKIKVTNIVKFYTLLLLFDEPRHGYEIIKKIGERLNKRISPGEIYPFLKLLRKHGYIVSKKVGKREKKVYHLTKNGKEFVKKMLNRFGDLIDIAIEPRLTVCAHCGCEVYRGGHKEKIKGKLLNFCCVHCAKSYKKQN